MMGGPTPVVDGQVPAAELRAAMGSFATGVAVVTTEVGGVPHGMTVNSLTSVSLDPPLLLVCFAGGSRTERAVAERGAFVVNVLARRQEALSTRFARRGEDHFAGLPTVPTELGLPLLPGSLASLACTVEATYPGGDHAIVVGRVRRCLRQAGTPLVFFAGRYHDLSGRGRDTDDWYW